MKMVVGLGNPGAQYQDSRHNVGFWVADELARRWGRSFKQDKAHESWICQAAFGDETCLLVKPVTYMNQSGRAVTSLLKYFKLSVQEILVILDDIFLSLGTLRLRLEGSSGGQKGLQSVLDVCQSMQIPRLRVGVGLPEDESQGWAGHVLSPFALDELETVRRAVDLAADAVERFVETDADAALKFINNHQSRQNKKES